MSTKTSVAFGNGVHLWRDVHDSPGDGLWLATADEQGEDVVADLPADVLDAIVATWPTIKAGRSMSCVTLYAPDAKSKARA